jgi:hypothetical protein
VDIDKFLHGKLSILHRLLEVANLVAFVLAASDTLHADWDLAIFTKRFNSASKWMKFALQLLVI